MLSASTDTKIEDRKLMLKSVFIVVSKRWWGREGDGESEREMGG